MLFLTVKFAKQATVKLNVLFSFSAQEVKTPEKMRKEELICK